MLPQGLTYPQLWSALYIARDQQKYACTVSKVHTDDIEPYYTIEVLEGPFIGERQTVPERLTSWVDKLRPKKIKQAFSNFEKRC
jgi:hypothetical protein